MYCAYYDPDLSFSSEDGKWTAHIYSAFSSPRPLKLTFTLQATFHPFTRIHMLVAGATNARGQPAHQDDLIGLTHFRVQYLAHVTWTAESGNEPLIFRFSG